MAHRWQAVKRIGRYLVGTKDFVVVIEPTIPQWRIECYVDADWATNTEGRRSVSGCVLLVAGMPVHTHSRTQKATALSSCESEPYAMVGGAIELTFVKTLLEEQGVGPISATIWSGSSSAIALACRKGAGTRLKHIALRASACRGWIRQKFFTVAKSELRRQWK